jgi:transposase-like protein
MIDGRAGLCPPVHYPISRAIICCCNVSRLPETQGDKPAKRKFKSYPIGYFHVDIAEVRTEEGKLYLFVAIDRTSKFAYAQLHEKANRRAATSFLKALIKAVPYKIHTVLTDNDIQFTDLPKNRLGPRARWRVHMFDSFVMR